MELKSPTAILDPVDWQSLRAAAQTDPATLATTLGSGALTFQLLASTTTDLAEASFSSNGVWSPGLRWSIGYPFGMSTSLFASRPFDAVFQYAEDVHQTLVTASIKLVPEVPEPASVALVAIAAVVAGGRAMAEAARTRSRERGAGQGIRARERGRLSIRQAHAKRAEG